MHAAAPLAHLKTMSSMLIQGMSTASAVLLGTCMKFRLMPMMPPGEVGSSSSRTSAVTPSRMPEARSALLEILMPLAVLNDASAGGGDVGDGGRASSFWPLRVAM